MYARSLRAAAAAGVSGGTRLGFALGRFGFGGARGGAVSTSAASASMERPKQPQQQQEDAVSGEKNTCDGTHKAHWDPMAHSFGEEYSTRAVEEGFGGVYARDGGDDEDDDHRAAHPEQDTSRGCEVREEEKGRHLKDD